MPKGGRTLSNLKNIIGAAVGARGPHWWTHNIEWRYNWVNLVGDASNIGGHTPWGGWGPSPQLLRDKYVHMR